MSVDGDMDAGAMEGPPRPPPEPADPVELLRERPELGAFGVDWVRAWAPHMKERLVEMAGAIRRYPWMAELIGQGPVGLVNPCSVEAHAGGSEACISLFGGWAYCSADGGVTVERLELEFSRLEPHGGWVREVYRPKKRSIFARTKEYVRIL